MYQIFVVEDELLIRQSIRNMIENLSGPYAFCGEASDGEMALSMMQDLMPDILLTDIKMPFLDGFELVRHLKAMMPWIKIIIISGFDDFEYAQKAISLGVDLYLLKPLRSADLAKAIDQLAHQIEAEKKEGQLPTGYDQDELRSALHQHFMHQLLNGSASTAALLEQARTLALDVIHPYYQLVLFSFDSLNNAAAGQGALQAAVMRVLGELNLPLYYFNEYDQLTLLLTGTEAGALNEDAYRIINILRHTLKEQCPVTTTVVGAAVQRMSAIADSYKTAKYTLRHANSLASGQVISVGDTSRLTADFLSFSSPFGGDFPHKLMAATQEDVPDLLKECLRDDATHPLGSALMRYYALIDLLKLTGSLISQSRPETDPKDVLAQLSQEYDFFAAAESFEGFQTLAEELLRKAVSLKQAQQAAGNPVIQRALSYVAQHFCDPNLSLLSVAKHVGMSSAYFSTVFSQTTGKPFISYLTGLRIEKAKQLLRDTDQKLSAIAMEIGYNEPNYFSHVFRKSEGMTPKEYRARYGAV